MTSREFCYWLQGMFELNAPKRALSKLQTDQIKAHLALVFKHEIDPSQGTPEHQAELQKIHDRIDNIESRPAPFDHNTPIRC
jgi:hypothetical protein